MHGGVDFGRWGGGGTTTLGFGGGKEKCQLFDCFLKIFVVQSGSPWQTKEQSKVPRQNKNSARARHGEKCVYCIRQHQGSAYTL